MLAIHQALQFIIHKGIDNPVIFTDSFSALTSIESGKSSRPDLLNKINLLITKTLTTQQV